MAQCPFNGIAFAILPHNAAADTSSDMGQCRLQIYASESTRKSVLISREYYRPTRVLECGVTITLLAMTLFLEFTLQVK